ncbi:hypothetical protein S7711_05349 [Stachybotrys chartarum IBT 7711]|uniref:Uncharacterized protein n=1 Tax=Stachybotrys chartarum (strain CBS 109288 / IBT 7711) TaxID=1280523 RepID=A0A084B968_STACB|nr:hypothetical protein S7711_05349 [Stachybotrys chartarum IBT 7711]
MTRVLAGEILGCCSAEVIKVEHPVRGDDTRAWGPPYAKYQADSNVEGPGESAYFLGVNRNKKSLALSFQHQEGVEILHGLVAKCDILVENYLPGTLKKYSMDYETLRAINPSLIYASITGYGQTGPYSSRAGYDVMVEAEFGLMHITGARDGPPVKVGVAVTDLTTGLYTSNSIMAALLSRARTGRGQHLDVALSDCQTATLANIASSCLISGQKDSGRWGTAHPSIVPYRSFKTKDGDVLFGGGNDRLFGILAAGLGQPQWTKDPKFRTNADRVANRQELEDMIEVLSQQKTTAEWLEVFEGKGMPYAAVNDVQQTLNHEHTRARNMVIDVEHDTCGTIKMVNTPVKYSESQPANHRLEYVKKHSNESLSSTNLRSLCAVACAHEARLNSEMEDLKQEEEPGQMDTSSHSQPSVLRLPQNGADQPPTKGVGEGQSAPTANARLPYMQQFSTTTSFILSRLKSGSGSLNSALSTLSESGVQPSKDAYEDARNRLVQTMNTSLAMPLRLPGRKESDSPVVEQTDSGTNGPGTPQSGSKRKRSSGPEPVDFTQSTISFPILPPLAPAAAKAAVVPASPSASDFKAKKRSRLEEENPDRRHEIEQLRMRRLSKLPAGVVPPKAELVGFGAGSASDRLRTEYFLGKRKTELLNILSFCDQLQPQLLADILVSVSKRHPDLPIFDSPDWEAQLKGTSRSNPSTNALASSKSRQSLHPTKPKQKSKAVKKLLKPSRTAEAQEEVQPEAEDALPATWRRAGEGLYARLVPEVEDRKFLVDDNDEEAFSQFMVDKLGKQIVEPV